MSPRPGNARRVHAAPQRRCVACRRTRDKQDLVRIARHGDAVALDLDQTRPGRGSYLCPDPACVDLALQRDAIRMRTSLRGGTTNQVQRALLTLMGHLTRAEHHKEHHA